MSATLWAESCQSGSSALQKPISRVVLSLFAVVHSVHVYDECSIYELNQVMISDGMPWGADVHRCYPTLVAGLASLVRAFS